MWALTLVVAAGIVGVPRGQTAAFVGRIVFNFNTDWRFEKADVTGASSMAFDDRGWTLVSTPHTFNDIDTFDNLSTPGHRGEQIQWSGRTWYRKSFRLPTEFRGRRVFIEFEGARQVAEVFINGVRLGVSKTGFTPFGFDLTPHLTFGTAANVLAVMCDNRFMKDPLDGAAPSPNLAQLSASVNETIPEALDDLQADQIPWNNPHWHPAHGGLYRNVRLHVMDPLHISLPLYSFLQTAGPYVYATDIAGERANVHVEVPVENGRSRDARVTIRATVREASGRPALRLEQTLTIGAGRSANATLAGPLKAPKFWEPGYPHVYSVELTVLGDEGLVDITSVPFGIRVARWDAAHGLSLNGRPVKLHGWGQKPTNEWPGLGAALPDWLHDFTLRLMKDAGGNFIRWGHAAAGPAQISASDRLGLIVDQPGVDGESDTRGAAWTLRASAFRDTIIYFRNNPSILIWEGGNQKVTRDHARELRALMDRYDPHGGRAYAHRRADQITAEVMDVGIGTEGGREIASLAVVEGEYDREESPRRVWDDATPPRFGYPEAKGQTYQLTSEQFAVNQVAQYAKKLGAPEHSGGANWIFSDSTSGGRVAVEVARASGEVDGVRLPKEAYFATAAMFRDDPRVHIIGHWTYPAGTRKTVYIVSNCDEVELFVNGRTVGRATPVDRYLFTFPNVVFEAGEISAKAWSGGKVLAVQSKRTVGPAIGLRISPITSPSGPRADGSDIVLFDVEAVDARGDRNPTAEARVDFSLSGPAVWRGGYNSGRVDSINSTYLDLEAGVARVSARTTRQAGPITLRASSAGLASAAATVNAVPFPAAGGMTLMRPAVPAVVLPGMAPPRNFGVFAVPSGPGVVTRGMVGRFVRSFSYSGPSASIVHVESLARDGRNAYIDADLPFVNLPPVLTGADWVQAANQESRYNAVDLMELSVVAGVTVSVAHDDRVPRPAWLTSRFIETAARVTIGGQSMTVFEWKADADASLTLGANSTVGATSTRLGASPGNMYIVFVGRPDGSR